LQRSSVSGTPRGLSICSGIAICVGNQLSDT
jgi:hypothetical protein